MMTTNSISMIVKYIIANENYTILSMPKRGDVIVTSSIVTIYQGQFTRRGATGRTSFQ